MIIYLDESKRLAKGQIVFWWFITKHNNHYINKFIEWKKEEYWFKQSSIELKSIKDTWKQFYENMIQDDDFYIIANNIVWISISWYYKDNKHKYFKIISILINKIYNWIKLHKWNITIISDMFNFWKDNSKIEKEIEIILNEDYSLYKWFKFKFVNSKNYWGVQLADLISYQLRLANISKDKKLDEFLIDNNFNINLNEIIEI